MQTLNFNVSHAVLIQIQSGKIDLVVKTSWNYYHNLEVGDMILFNRSIFCRVVGIRRYKNFDDMLGLENHERIFPGCTPEQVLSSLRKVHTPAYEALGVLVLEIKVVT